ncbi:MAG: biotin--[acetyl-CoA-carboxylase] ligase [Marinicaulis sp.]|nr:biotin--[acetyl-CoA-carboxylase] ligase [Marinicaulis sp.]NNE42539.1 biotin--[acetyl-CoA-carboxylase] ligase [Marinicaulis sp.]
MPKLESGAELRIFYELKSTQTEAKQVASTEGIDGPIWFVALRQTTGYGRRGREWQQDVGDFSGTLALRNPDRFNSIGELTFITGLAVAKTLNQLADRGDVKIKWPNDVLVDGRKIAGILLELVDDGAVAIIGIGVNIVSAPDGLDYPTACLGDYCKAPPKPEAFANVLDEHFWRLQRIWRKEGFAPIRAAWVKHCTGLGYEITVRLPNETLTGTFDSIDESGALLLRSGDETQIIRAGDVFFRKPA